MKVGDYVRTEDGIKKVLKYTYNDRYENGHCVWFDNKDYGILFTDEEVNKMKPSPNIIELIEDDDLVEIEYYSERYEERITRVFLVDYVIKKDISFINGHCQLNIFDGEWARYDKRLKPMIKSIVTKEQFESMEYKVGE